MIKRELYLERIRPYIDKPYIKVLTGIRRCGKSSLLLMVRDELIASGIPAERILQMNLESMNFSDIEDSKALYQWVKDRITTDDQYYILLDEIQEVHGWEKAVNSFLVDFKLDIFITGSNSRLLSSELATYLAGRYVEIHVSTLSFKEFIDFKEKRTGERCTDTKSVFKEFLRLGGFPAVCSAEYSYEEAYRIIYDIYSSAILRDTVQRHGIRNIELLERIVRYVFDNVGNTFSAKRVADYFKSQQRKVDLNTVYNYLSALESAFIIQKVPRYDVKGREILKTNEKYYLGDQSLKYALMGYKDREISGSLENIVMLELKRRGYRVFVGKQDQLEIDFIGEKQEEKVYIQVSYQMASEETVDREFKPLLDVRDHHPKYVVTMDELWQDNIEGVRHVHIADFLLMEWQL